jgi:hypothetical protein
MCYKSPGVEDGKSAVRPLSPEGMATACRYQAGPQLSSLARPTSRAIGLQLKIVAPSSRISLPRIMGFFIGPDLILGLQGASALVSILFRIGRVVVDCRVAADARSART